MAGRLFAERRDADGPRAGIAGERGGGLGQAHLERDGAEAPGCRHESVGVVLALIHLGEDGDALALTQSAELEFLGAQIDERERHGHGRFLALVR